MGRLVYFITSHTNPEQVVRLVKTINKGSPGSIIVIHHDYSCTYLEPASFRHMDNLHIFKDHISIEWGRSSRINMHLQSIDWMLDHLDFDWMMLISGQDYPIQPFVDIEKFLRTTNYDGFLRGVSLEKTIPCGSDECMVVNSNGGPCIDCTQRYYYQYYNVPSLPYYDRIPSILKILSKRMGNFVNRKQSLLKIRSFTYHNQTRTLVGMRPISTHFDNDFHCYKGSDWFTLSHKCLRYIREFLRNNPKFLHYYLRTLHASESFFHTILMNNPELKIRNDNMRYIRWSGPKVPHPDTLGARDYDHIISSKKHFARKFDINVDAEILGLLDQHIFNGTAG